MPNRINPFPQLNRVTHDPTITISGDPRKAMQPYPFGEDAFNAEVAAFWAMLEKVFAPVWNGIVNTANEWISWFNPAPGSTDPNIFTNLLNQWGVDTLNGVATILEGLLGTTVFQSLLDSIAVSMGHSGTGHTIADIETYLGLIPGPNIATPIGAGVVPGLDASKITSGAFAQSMITGLGASLSALLGASTFQLLLDAIANIMGHSGTGHTITDVGTYLGLIPGPNIATPIGAGVVPGLDASKITSGAFAQSMITGLGASLSALLGTSTFNALVDSIANALGHAGTGYTLTNIGVYLGLIPGTNIATPVTASVVPGLDASKITSGAFAQSMITGLGASLSALLGTSTFNALVDAIANALGHAGTGYTLTNIGVYLGLIPGTNIATPVSSSVVPALDASKITTGQFPQSQTTNLIPDLLAKLGINIFNASATAGPNMVISPDFEDSTIQRVFNGNPGTGYSTTRRHSGTQSFKHVALAANFLDVWFIGISTTSNSINDSTFKVQPGQHYYAEVWVWAETANTNSHVMLYPAFFDSTGVNSVSYASAPDPVIAKGQWIKMIVNAVVPPGYDRMLIAGSIRDDNATNDVFYWDDALVRDDTATQLFNVSATAGTNLVIDPGFEDPSILRPNFDAPGSLAYSTDQKHSGTQCLKGIHTTTGVGGKDVGFMMLPVSTNVPGWSAGGQSTFGAQYMRVSWLQKYRIEAWVFPKSTNVAGGHVRLGVYFRNSITGAQTWVETAGGGYVPTPNQWNQLSEIYTVPLGYDQIQPYAYAQRVDNAIGNIYYWDDVNVQEESATQGIINQLFGGTTVASAILPAAVPGIDASKITTGTLATPQIPAVTKAMSPDMQKIVDAVNQALGGGASTGTAIASMFQNLKQIPPANILINTSSATVVTQVSAGAGNKNVGNALGTISTSWTETIAATANYTVVPIAWSANIGSGAIARDVTIGGRAASSLGFQEDTVNGTVVEMFGLPNPPTGAQTVVATASYVFGTFKWISGESVSYAGWGGTTPAVTSSGSGSSPSHTVAAAVNEKIVHAFMEYTGVATGEALSAYNRTSRYNSGAMDVSGTSGTLLVGDADGGASIAFTATPAAVGAWNSIAVRLQPAGATLPSMCHVVRTTGNVAISSGANLLPNSFFAASPLNLSSDLTWDATNNKVTVSVPGNYIVEIGLANTGVAANNTQMGPVLYWGSGAGAASIFKRGDTAANAISKVSTFVIPLKANDYVRPGAFIAIANNLAGEATGTYTYMTVTLASRGLVS